MTRGNIAHVIAQDGINKTLTSDGLACYNKRVDSDKAGHDNPINSRRNEIMEGKQRINKITATFMGDGVSMSLYRTHNKIGTLTNSDIDIKPFAESGAANKPAYMAYCKETLINLLQNGGVEGYYYDPKPQNEQAESGMPRKFDANTFAQWSKQIVLDVTGKMELPGIAVGISDKQDIEPKVDERYKDGAIKYGSTIIPIEIKYDSQPNINAIVTVQIRSGQLSKPKKFVVGDKELGLNPTAIKSLVKGDDKPASKPVVSQEKIEDAKVVAEEKIPEMVCKTTAEDIPDATGSAEAESNQNDSTEPQVDQTPANTIEDTKEPQAGVKEGTKKQTSNSTEKKPKKPRQKKIKDVAKDDIGVQYAKDMAQGSVVSSLMDSLREE